MTEVTEREAKLDSRLVSREGGKHTHTITHHTLKLYSDSDIKHIVLTSHRLISSPHPATEAQPRGTDSSLTPGTKSPKGEDAERGAVRGEHGLAPIVELPTVLLTAS